MDRYIVEKMTYNDIEYLMSVEEKYPVLYRPGQQTTKEEWKYISDTYEHNWILKDIEDDSYVGFFTACEVQNHIWIRKVYMEQDKAVKWSEGFSNFYERPIPRYKLHADKHDSMIIAPVHKDNFHAMQIMVGLHNFDAEPQVIEKYYGSEGDLSVFTYNYNS